MKTITISIILILSPLFTMAQDHIAVKDSIKSIQGQVLEMINQLGYGDTVHCVYDINNDVKCEVVKAYYESKYYLHVELRFTLCKSEKTRLEFRRGNGLENLSNFCILNERYISTENGPFVLRKDIPVNQVFKFNIFEQKYPTYPRLIEYLKLTEQSGQEFFFRNIPIVYDGDK